MNRTVGPRESLAATIVGLGVLAIAVPLVVDKMPSVATGMSPAFILAGMSVLIGIFVVIAGIMSFIVKD
jgi:hypothetical protein